MTTTINASTVSGLVNSADTSGILQLQTASTAALTIDASQNVGIGITSPTRKLAVSGTWTNTGDYLMDSGSPQLAWTSGDLRFKTGGLSGTEVVRIDSSGNVGIGTTSPAQRLDVQATTAKVFVTSTTGTNTAYFAANNTGGAFQIGLDNSAGTEFGAAYAGVLYRSGANPIVFYTNAAERMRIDSSGNLLVGTTSVNFASSGLTLSTNAGSTKWLVGPISANAGNFYVATSGSTGVYLAGTSATSWSSNSDERLKTDLVPIENATTKVASMRSVTGRYKTDPEGTSRSFLIAQDVQAVLPEAVSASKIAGSDDDTEYLGVAYTEVIPLLVASIKELKTINDTQAETINALTARIVALETA
jgi:hypothetical protein